MAAGVNTTVGAVTSSVSAMGEISTLATTATVSGADSMAFHFVSTDPKVPSTLGGMHTRPIGAAPYPPNK